MRRSWLRLGALLVLVVGARVVAGGGPGSVALAVAVVLVAYGVGRRVGRVRRGRGPEALRAPVGTRSPPEP